MVWWERGPFIVVYLWWEFVLKMKLTQFLFLTDSQEESNANKIIFLLTVRLALAAEVETFPTASQGWTFDP